VASTLTKAQKTLSPVLFRWQLIWLVREKLVFSAAACAFVLGVLLSWYQLPASAVAVFDARLWSVPIEKGVSAVGVIFTLAALLGKRHCPQPGVRFSLWGILVLVLAFPYTLSVWSPSVSYLAASFSGQEDRVAKHIDRTLPFAQSQWKQNILLDAPQPVTSVLGPTVGDARFFATTAIEPLLTDGFGFKSRLLRFAGRGWHMAFIASVTALFGVYLAGGLRVLMVDLYRLLPAFALVMVGAMLPMLYANFADWRLETAMATGNYQQVISESQVLRRFYPLVNSNERFLVRLAGAQTRLGVGDPALVNFAWGSGLYRQKKYLQAIPYFSKALSLQPDLFLARGYLATALTMQGYLYFNQRLTNVRLMGLAADNFEQALVVYPDHVEAAYDLMLTRTVNGDQMGAAAIAYQLIDLESYNVEQPNLSLISQAYLHIAWERFHSHDLPSAWQRFRQAHDNTLWKSKRLDEE
jgi:tetratricopeptide (TPR) repeat protein